MKTTNATYVIERLEGTVVAVTPCDQDTAMGLAHAINCANARAGGDIAKIVVTIGENRPQ